MAAHRPVLKVVARSDGPVADKAGARKDDAAIAAGVARGEAGAVRALTRRCLPTVYGVARRLLRDATEAEDVAQDVFTKVWRKIDSFDPARAKLETWVARIAMNLCYDRLRKRREETLDGDLPDRCDVSPGADERLAAADTAGAVRAAVARLPERQRVALELCCFQEHTNIEAAEILQISVEAVESLLARARRKLREDLSADRDSLLAGFAYRQGDDHDHV